MNWIRSAGLVFTGVLSLAPYNFVGCVRNSEVGEVVEERHNSYPKMVLRWEAATSEELRPSRLEDIVQFNREFIDASFKTNRKVDLAGNFSDMWRSARKTVEDGHGDCKDVVSLACYFAEKLGYSPKMLLFRGNRFQSGHAICLLESKLVSGEKRYGFIDRGVLIKPDYKSAEELVNQLNKKYIDAKGIKGPWNEYKIIELDSLGCDWRESRENLWPYLERAAGEIKWINVK